jgi:hypothetical protein
MTLLMTLLNLKRKEIYKRDVKLGQEMTSERPKHVNFGDESFEWAYHIHQYMKNLKNTM